VTFGLKLHGFFNSSASYRVRIALELKGLAWQHVGVDIRSGVQETQQFRRVNPNGLVPVLEMDGQTLSQSLAIIDKLDRLQPEPLLVPADGFARDRVLEIAYLVACDIHPLNNLRVLKYLKGPLSVTDEEKNAWYAHWLEAGLQALETLLHGGDGWCVGETPTLADCCLVPQVANALRMGFDVARFPRIHRVHAFCQAHPAFQRAAPGVQPDFLPA
jgi:maleylacetoacetate isomerase